jgi:hypothetical protein
VAILTVETLQVAPTVVEPPRTAPDGASVQAAAAPLDPVPASPTLTSVPILSAAAVQRARTLLPGGESVALSLALPVMPPAPPEVAPPGPERLPDAVSVTTAPVVDALFRTAPDAGGAEKETAAPAPDRIALVNDFQPDAAERTDSLDTLLDQAEAPGRADLRVWLLTLAGAGLGLFVASRRRKERRATERSDAVWLDGPVERWAL